LFSHLISNYLGRRLHITPISIEPVCPQRVILSASLPVHAPDPPVGSGFPESALGRLLLRGQADPHEPSSSLSKQAELGQRQTFPSTLPGSATEGSEPIVMARCGHIVARSNVETD
jgi:hypothetical protein